MNISGPRFVPTHTNIVELDRIGDEIAELSAHLGAATARLLDLIREFDARGGWNNGFLSCAHWLCYRVGLEMRAARERVRVARALGRLPRLAQALARGELSYSKVRTLTRIAMPETEERLLKVGLAGTAEQVERIVRGWRRVDRKVELEETSRRHKHRALHVYHDDDGMVIVRARLEPQAGAVLIQAIAAALEALRQRAPAKDAAVDGAAGPQSVDGPAGPQLVDGSAEPRYQDGSPEAPTIEQQEADALALVAETALHHGIDPGAPGERYQVVIHVDAAVLADADAPGQSVGEDGAYVPAETSQRLACDASRVVMRHDADGRITEVGARTRTIPPALRRALEHRDQGCRFPGCGRRFGQGHHIRHWAHGGRTILSNLTMLCRRHHRAVHEEGFQVERQADGELCFRRPDGTVIAQIPAPSSIPSDPAAVLRERNAACGIHIDTQTSKPGWLGEWLDVGYTIDVLHPAATGERPTISSPLAAAPIL
jgi:hypothetical protein